jgi:hypothetical protein
MKRALIFGSGFALALTLAVVTGCDKGTQGGPGATNPPSNNPLAGQGDDTFTLHVPSGLPHFETSLKQGETKETSISIKKGKNFDQDVTLKFAEPPTGVTFDPASPVIKHGDTEVKFKIVAKDDAAVGDFTIKVTGHPTKGGDAEKDFKLKVEKK